MAQPDNLNDTFVSIISRALRDLRCEQVVFPEPGEVFVGSNTGEALTIVFILKGSQTLRYYRQGRIVEDVLQPGKVQFSGPYCPWALDWRHPCHRLGISCYNHRLGMSWNCLQEGIEGLEILPDRWFCSELQPGSDTWYLLRALAARREAKPDSPLTVRLPELILQSVREHLRLRDILPMSSLDTFTRICHYLDNHYAQPINRDTVARTFSLNPDYVTRLFHEKGNVLFSHYLRDLRLSKAEDLLKNSSLPVGDIAEACGFGSSSYFIRVFRETYTCSPSVFRRR